MALPRHAEMYPLEKLDITPLKNDFPTENAKSFTTKEEQDAQKRREDYYMPPCDTFVTEVAPIELTAE